MAPTLILNAILFIVTFVLFQRAIIESVGKTLEQKLDLWGAFAVSLFFFLGTLTLGLVFGW